MNEISETEDLAAEVHAVYCRAYETRYGKPKKPWSEYAELCEQSKNFYRDFARWHLGRTENLQVAMNDVAARLQEAYIRIEALDLAGASWRSAAGIAAGGDLEAAIRHMRDRIKALEGGLAGRKEG